jgi:predicted RNase H-like nuclease (RuvC/YqgF family)
MELEALELREELDRLKGRLQKPKQRDKKLKSVSKRFKVLYKNLAFTDRAVEGFSSLPDDLQMRAEEVILRLNQDDSQISVRRKVFAKKGKMNVLELDFSYSGRIYLRKNAGPKTEIVVIGTKNSQKKDLAFLETMG